MKILVIGSINMDLTTYVDRLPTQGETKFGSSFKQNPGGKGANQACACALAGGDVTMLGAVGNDSYGTVLEKTLKECNVVPKLKYDDSVSSGCAIFKKMVSTFLRCMMQRPRMEDERFH